MAKYQHYTSEQKEKARNTDLVELLRSRGETLKRSGKDFVWQHGDEKICVRGNLWYHHYTHDGGDAISFVQKYMGMTYQEAMQFLTDEGSGELKQATPVEKKEKGEFALPAKSDSFRKMYGYLLHSRGISYDVISTFVKQGMLYESADYHNAVFVGYDKNNIAQHANLRGTNSKSSFKCNTENSRPEYSFHWHGMGERLYVFESPIDMLSYITMNPDGWKDQSYCACCGVGYQVMWQMLQDNPYIKTVVVCLDNDQAGKNATKRMVEDLYEKGITSEILFPEHKDWNEDLLQAQDPAEGQEVALCQA